MRRLTMYELEILDTIKKDLNIFDRLILSVFKEFTFKVFQVGARQSYFKE
ncbi:MAG: hypothetical protein IJ272_05750 [Clostridia bacterium]|nr:hypothetical protein [Clostridia bacterium]